MMHVQFGGRYRLQVFHGDTDILLKDTGWFDNLITNNGLDLLGTGFSFLFLVGSDTADPAITDTAIANVLASTNSATGGASVHNITTAPYYSSMSWAVSFGIGAIQGTIGQVAIGSSATNLFSKARLTTSGGAPTTLTLSGVDRLTLTYELRLYIRTTDIAGSIDINGVSYATVNRAADIGNQGLWRPAVGAAMGNTNAGDWYYNNLYYGGTSPFIGALTGYPSGTAVQADSGSRAAYIPGTYVRGFTVGWSAGKGNIANITAFVHTPMIGGGYSNSGAWQTSLVGPALNKNQYQNFVLEGQYSWGRYP